jgi:hypothetical protein
MAVVAVESKISIKADGTAIEGVCVTGEAIRPIVPVASIELSRRQAGIACPDLSGAQFLQVPAK